MGEPKCATTDHVVLWVRDPISRLCSTWNFKGQWRQASVLKIVRSLELLGKDEAHLDLEAMLAALRARHTDDTSLFEDLYLVLKSVQHATTDTAFYLGDAAEHAERWVDKSSSCQGVLDQLPVWFVGRSEHMTEDWDKLVMKTTDRQRQVDVVMPHTHATPRQGKELSKGSVAVLRKFYAADYACIRTMVDKGWLERAYVDAITRDDKVYSLFCAGSSWVFPLTKSCAVFEFTLLGLSEDALQGEEARDV
eukprot:731099-Rhodomonas_salina.1